jgi:glutamyl-tRNA reductase
VEIYCLLEDAGKDDAIKRVLKFWSTKTGVSLDLIEKAIRVYHGKEALKHLFYLASGLESLVLGEDQILGQVRTAYVKAKNSGTSGLFLDKAFMKAVNIGRRVRTETKINEGSVSVSSAAVDLAAKQLGNLTSTKALVIGAGEAGSLIAEALRSHGISTIIVANRTYRKSVDLAEKVSGKAIRFDRMLSILPDVDLVFGAVSVTKPILSQEQMARILAKSETSKRLLLIDISQPRAFGEEIGNLPGINLKTIDDLKEVVAENIRNRQIEAIKCETLILEELTRFELEISKLYAAPLISEILRKFEEIRQKELARARRKLGESDEKKLLVLERFSRELIERVAQTPIEQLRRAALNGNGELLGAAEQIFQARVERLELAEGLLEKTN